MIVLSNEQAAEVLREAHEAGKSRRMARAAKTAFRAEREELKSDALRIAGFAGGGVTSAVLDGLGYLEPRGVPLDLVAGVGLTVASFWGGLDRGTAFLCKNVGTGAATHYLMRQAREFGRSMAKPASTPQAAASPAAWNASTVAGALPPYAVAGAALPPASAASAGPLSDTELAELIHATVREHDPNRQRPLWR